MKPTPKEDLDLVFGPGEETTPEGRALNSRKLWVKSIDQIAEDSEAAKGRRLTAKEALDLCGFDTLLKVAYDGSAPLSIYGQACGRVLAIRRGDLNLDTRHVAHRAKVTPSQVEAAEASKRLPVRVYERIARSLGIDERFLSVRNEPIGNEGVTIRLRAIGEEYPRLTPGVVSPLAEAAWVAMTQFRLEGWLCGRPGYKDFSASPNYGSPAFPAFRWGYQLADETREKLAIDDNPIESMRELVEKQLGIPIIQTELGDDIAGATLEADGHRAIVLNLGGKNRHVFVRRMTIAHELGHVLYDPPRELAQLRVDNFDELDAPAEKRSDSVEQRANAFGAELLIPQDAALAFRDSHPPDVVGGIMDTFGVSFTTARYQIWNALERSVQLESLTTEMREPSPHWEAMERYTVDFHPIRDLRPSRAGRFSALVFRAAEENYISWDTAAEWLESTPGEIQREGKALRDLFPAVFGL